MALDLFKRVETRKGLFAVEKITLIYNLLTSILILFLFQRMDHPWHMLLDRAMIAAMTFLLMYLYRLAPCKFSAFVRIVIQMSLLSYWYPDTFEFNRFFPNLDHVFATAEEFIFNGQPAIWFCHTFPHLIVSEAFNMGYFFYYPMMLIVALFYFIYKFEWFEKMSFVLVTSFFIYYLIYIFVPVAGPQFYFPAIGIDNVSKGIFPAIGDYFNYNQDKKGLQILDRILKAEPDNGFVHFYLADYYRSKKELKEADKHTKEALVSDKIENGYKIQYILKLILNPDTTLTSDSQLDNYMNLLMQKYSDDLSVRALHSDFLKKDHKLAEARNELEYILSKDKNNYLIWEELLLMCNEMGDTTCMYRHGIEAIKYFPEQPLPYALSGIALMMQKQFAEALPLFEKGVELTDDKPELRSQFYSYLADCYYNLDSVERAFKMFDEVLKINPNDILVLNNYAYYLSLRNERLALAEKMSSQAVAMESDNATYLDTYAWVLYKRGEYSQARYYIKLAIEKDKDPSGVLYEHYGDILYRSGEHQEALKMWKKAAEMGGGVSEELNDKIQSGKLSD